MAAARTRIAIGIIALAAILAARSTSGQPAPPDPALAARIAAADLAAGEVLASQCTICHTLAAGGPTLIGPNLYDIVGAPIARTAGYAYSPPMASLGAAGGTWTVELLDAFLASPATTVVGTRMGFGGLASETDRTNLIGWLRTQSVAPAEMAGMAAVDPTTPVYEAYQADRGRNYYGDSCGICHGPTAGGDTAPPLKGPVFQANWNGRTVWELFNYTRRNMPADAPGGLEDERIARILAYILQENGYEAGPMPFRVDRASLEQLILRF
ncbi:MAG: c-type cytochrome [Bauldia sp.]|nr:c-type cytochrome [Bauldia sp.]